MNTKKTNSNIPLQSYYGESPGPGEYPFTSGIYPDMYRGRLWTMRQYAGFSSAEESNKRYRYLIDEGVMGLSVAFDLPTQTGYNSNHPMADGEVGRAGVPICCLSDMDILTNGISLNKMKSSTKDPKKNKVDKKDDKKKKVIRYLLIRDLF